MYGCGGRLRRSRSRSRSREQNGRGGGVGYSSRRRITAPYRVQTSPIPLPLPKHKHTHKHLYQPPPHHQQPPLHRVSTSQQPTPRVPRQVALSSNPGTQGSGVSCVKNVPRAGWFRFLSLRRLLVGFVGVMGGFFRGVGLGETG